MLQSDQEAVNNYIKGDEVRLLELCEHDAPLMTLWKLPYLEDEQIAKLSPFAAARYCGVGRMRSLKRSAMAITAHQEAIRLGHYQALMESCVRESDDCLDALRFQYMAEIGQQLGKLEQKIAADSHLRHIESSTDTDYKEAYRYEGDVKVLMMTSAGAYKAAVALGMKNLYPDLIVALRDLNEGEEMVEMYRRFLMEDPGSSKAIGLIQGVLLKEDQMVEVLQMIEAAVRSGYPEAIAQPARYMELEFEFRDPRIGRAEFFERLERITR